MRIPMSQESSKKLLSTIKWLSSTSKSYLTSLGSNSTSSGKKLVNALLLIPVIIPSAVTISCFVCTYLLVNAISAKEDDFKLFKVLKGIARLLIYIAAFVTLAVCTILNLAISLIPFLIFRAINRNLNQKKSDDITKVENVEEGKKLIENVFTRESSDGSEQPIGGDVLNQISGQPNQPKITIISQETDPAMFMVSGRGSKGIVQTVGDRRSINIGGLFADSNEERLTAIAFNSKFCVVPGGIDLNFSLSVRTGKKTKRNDECIKRKFLRE